MDTLTAEGWQRGERTSYGECWHEPTGLDDEDNPGGAYSLLCSLLPPLAGEGSSEELTEEHHDSLPTFTWRADWSCWELSGT